MQNVSSNNMFCSRCGAPLQPEMMYCPKCGTAVPQPNEAPFGATTAGTPPNDWREMRRQWKAQKRAERYEKYEKGEKHSEKAEKGSRGGSILGPVVGGSILIWLGVTYYLEQISYLPGSDWWAYFLAGIGVILIVQGLLSYGLYRGPLIGSFIGGVILFIIGLSVIENFVGNLWPLILVIIGIAIVISSIIARRRRPPPPPPSTTI
jgi:hypothetical protein